MLTLCICIFILLTVYLQGKVIYALLLNQKVNEYRVLLHAARFPSASYIHLHSHQQHMTVMAALQLCQQNQAILFNFQQLSNK